MPIKKKILKTVKKLNKINNKKHKKVDYELKIKYYETRIPYQLRYKIRQG